MTVSPIVSTTAISESGFGGNEQSADQELGNKGENWVVVLRTPRRIIDALVWAQTKQFLLIGFLSIFFLAWLALAFVRRSTEPIIRLVELTEQVGRGDLNKQIEVSSKDEIGKLAESFNRMVISLRETMASRDELTAEIEKRIKVEEELKFLSTVDELTQLYNRRAFNDYLAKMTLHAKRYSEPLSIAMIDIDRFKEINDHHGHSVGDSVLRKLSRVFLENIRSADILARWGGEEFILLMPNITAEEAHLAVERLRSLVGSVEFARGISLTVSIGITQLQADDSTDDLLKRVDAAQYKAKSLGRNNVQSL